MYYRKLGGTDVNISVIGIGTHQFGGGWDSSFNQKRVDFILDHSRKKGINLIDTAPCYGKSHLSERFIGNSIKKNRDEWIIATKFGQKLDSKTNKEVSDFQLSHIKKQLKSSLKALKTEYIDLYQFHSGTNDEFDNSDVWSYLNKQKDKGIIGNLGISLVHSYVSKGDTFQLEKVRDVGADFIQAVYNRLTRDAESKFLSYCERENIGFLARVPLAKGFLSGNYLPGHSFSSKDHRSFFGSDMNNSLLERVQKIKNSEVPDGVPMNEWALAWCLRNKAVTSVIPGCKNHKQVESNISSLKYL